MGQGQTKQSKEFKDAIRLVDQTVVSNSFESIRSGDGQTNRVVTKDQFVTALQLPEPIGSRLFDLLSQPNAENKEKPGIMNFDMFVCNVVRATQTDKAAFTFDMFDVNGDGVVDKGEFTETIEGILRHIHTLAPDNIAEKDVRIDLDDLSARIGAVAFCKHTTPFLKDQIFHTRETPTKETKDAPMTRDEFDEWARDTLSFSEYFTSFVNKTFLSANEEDVEELASIRMQFPVLSEPSRLLGSPHVWVINRGLPPPMTHEWKLLYSSTKHGLSMSGFAAHVENVGPTVIIVRSKKGDVFGAFASENWKEKPKFFGDHNCFLFRLVPDMKIFPTTGYNDHFQYFQLHAETLPHGLGMGGQHGFMGLWLNHNFTGGHAKAKCSTYWMDGPLSSEEEFELDYVEAWHVIDLSRPVDSEEEELKKKSVLDHAEDKFITDMIGRTGHSNDVRHGHEEEHRQE